MRPKRIEADLIDSPASGIRSRNIIDRFLVSFWIWPLLFVSCKLGTSTTSEVFAIETCVSIEFSFSVKSSSFPPFHVDNAAHQCKFSIAVL
jgi:hypothetical protein